jgi:TRAP-type uncharacterized transport system substrate-binding protein
MPRFTHFSTLSFKDVATTYVPVLLVVALLLWVTYLAIDPTPPRSIVLAAGLKGSAYDEFAQKYRAVLARHHIDVQIRPSAGSMQNLHGLAATRPDAAIAFIQSGTSNDEAPARSNLVSLGSLFVEPVWVFYREAAVEKVRPDASPASRRPPTSDLDAQGAKAVGTVPVITEIDELRGLSVNVGPLGSGGPRLMRQLLTANEVDQKEVGLTYLDDGPAAEQLLDGRLDAVMLVTAPEAALVQMLLRRPGIRLLAFAQAEAYSRRFPFLKHVVLPRGIVSLARNIPDRDIDLIAPTATLVARSDTHPAIIELLVEAAEEIHGGPSWFGQAGEFPNDRYTEVAISPVAEHFYKNGPPFLERYLPFWLANLMARMGVVIVPLIALLIPLSRILPPLYNWRVRSRVYRWYGQLRAVEADIDAGGPMASIPQDDLTAASTDGEAKRARSLARLDGIEAKVNRLVVPLSYANELYSLKLHIDRVRSKLREGP